MRRWWLLAGLLLAGCGGLDEAEWPQMPQMPLWAPFETPAGMDPRVALAHVAELSDGKYQGRFSGSQGEYRADEYILKRFSDLGYQPVLQPFQASQFDGTARNILALIEGEDPTRFVVIGAHKDHIGYRGSKVYFGANDNAAGVAGVLEIARVLRSMPKPPVSVLLMCFSGEEEGLVGSSYYTRNPVIPQGDGLQSIALKQVKAMVNLDVIANGRLDRFSTDAVSQHQPQVERLAKRHGMAVDFRPFKAHAHLTEQLPPWASSDHAAFRKAGVKSLLFYAEPIHRYLHSVNDTIQERDSFAKEPDEVFNPEKLGKLAQMGLDQAMTWAREP